MSVRVVIADDQAMVRTGLRLVLSTQDDLEVVGEAGDGDEAVELARRLRPDVVLLDIAMPRADGLAAARRILSGTTPPRVIMLTTFDTDENLRAALAAGVSGFLLKVSPPEQLFAAVRAAARGEALLDPAVTSRVIAGYAGVTGNAPDTGGAGYAAKARPADVLTPRELDVLRLIARGLSNAEMAAALFIGEATVGTHVNRLLAKLALRDRAQLVRYAYESGVVRAGQG
ncbi:response regulator [Sphaerisporangium perillae]|uniref:response regulator n=1 Tax=Sphaerisporangium perillae TaxID=2935860 RepID=UPI00200C78CF|nr:response regulator transcription factor [Sphaerisporangium perillae]